MNRTGFSAVTHAWAAIVVNQPGEAVEALSYFDPYPEWRRAGAHSYWQYLTWALHMLGEYERELAEARAGRDLYPVRADLLGSEVRSLAALGRVDEVMGLLNEASGLLDDPVPAMLVAGEELRAHGHLQGSKVAYSLAIDWLNAMPPVAAADSTHRRYFAEALYGSERWEDAHQVALTLAQEAPDDVAPLGMVGSTAARLGDSVLAREISDQLAAMDHRKRRGEHSHLRACISALLGEPDEAMRLLRQAFSEGKRYFPSVFREMDLESLRDRADYQALMRPKG
jgi:tetratricopeptide (TPR) repeat protein